jgi:hypothetical protein
MVNMDKKEWLRFLLKSGIEAKTLNTKWQSGTSTPALFKTVNILLFFLPYDFFVFISDGRNIWNWNFGPSP